MARQLFVEMELYIAHKTVVPYMNSIALVCAAMVMMAAAKHDIALAVDISSAADIPGTG